jgi:hypothetical protein
MVESKLLLDRFKKLKQCPEKNAIDATVGVLIGMRTSFFTGDLLFIFPHVSLNFGPRSSLGEEIEHRVPFYGDIWTSVMKYWPSMSSLDII